MSIARGSLPMFALTFVVALAIGAVVAAACVAVLRRRVLDCEPARRHRALVVLAALPLLLAVTLTLSAALPAVASVFVPAIDHCDLHDDDHAHLCFQHGPHAVSPAVILVLLLVAGSALARGGRAVVRLTRSRRVVAALLATGDRDALAGVTVVESTLPICMVAGLRRPRILIARELLSTITREQLAIVLAHEREHVRRRDAWVMLAMRLLCTLHVPAVGRWLSGELVIAAEQACDEAAARRIGDREAVASTILAMQRAWMEPALAGPGFAVHALRRRVLSLLRDPVQIRSLAVPAWCLLGTIAALLAATCLLHHLAESTLSHLVS